MKGDWGDGSVSTMLTRKAPGPEFGFPAPSLKAGCSVLRMEEGNKTPQGLIGKL